MAAEFVFLSLLVLLATGVVGWYFYSHREKMGCMESMMAGMVFAGTGGTAVGTIYTLSTGDYVGGAIYGTLAGLAIGAPLGWIGGAMGRMEAVMAAPMGGFMGAMLGIMVRIYDVKLFVTFFVAVIAIMLGEMAYFTYKHVNERRPDKSQLAFAGTLVVAIVFASTFLNVPVSAIGGVQLVQGQGLGAAPAQPTAVQAELQASQAQVEEQAPEAAGGVQEATIRLEPFGYEPEFLTLKANTPTRLKLQAHPQAGCTRAFTIRSLGIRKTVPRGGSDEVELPPQPPGLLQFACSMGMSGGTIKFT